MAGEDVKISVGVDVGGAVASFREIEKAANDIKYSTKDLKNIQIGLKSAGIKADLADIKSGLDSVIESEKRALTKNYAESAIKGGIAARKADIKAREEQDRIYNQYLDDERKGLERNAANERKVIADNNAMMQKYDNERAARAQRRADEEKKLTDIRAAREVESAQYINGMRNKQDEKQRQYELTSFRDNILRRAEEDAAQKKSIEDAVNALPRLRYALYDVANTSRQVSQSVIQLGTDVVSTAASYETAFTNVQRVTDLTDKQTVALRQSLKDLATQIPLSFQDLSGITTLGAQLGISEDRLVGFTETVSKFSSVANVSNEETAKSFGALSELLNFSSADFEKFGSAVAYAGKEAVATESEILSVATQIGGVAGAAGFSAESVVGLSTALASLRIPAEQSRGAMTRFLQETNRAVAENGPQLQMFAQVIGMSTEEAANLAKTDMSGFFNRFVQGLQGMDPQNLTLALDALGLADQRVTNTLTRLASNFNVVEQSQANASKGFQDGTFLSEAFGQKADDLASKIQFLQNALANLGDTIGSQLSPYVGQIVDFLALAINSFADFASSDLGKYFVNVAVGVGVLVAVISTLITAIAMAAAGSAAFVTVLSSLKSAQFIAFFTGIIGQFTGVTVSAGVATAALTAFRIALLLSGVGIVAAVIGSVAAAMANTAKNSVPASAGTSQLSKSIADAKAKSQGLNPNLEEMNKQFNDIGSGSGGGSAGRAADKIRTLTDYANDLSAVFSRAFDIRFSSGSGLDAITKSFNSMAKATADASGEIKSLNADIQSLQADQALQKYFLSVAEAYGDTLKAQEIRANLAKIDADLTSKTKSLQTAQDKTNKTLVGNSEAAISNRSEITNLVKQYEEYVKSLAASGMKQDELAAKTAELKADFVSQASQLGYNSTELATYAAAFDDVSFAIDNIPRNVTVDIDPNPAKTALAEILAKAQETASGINNAFGGIDTSIPQEQVNNLTGAIAGGTRETGIYQDRLENGVVPAYDKLYEVSNTVKNKQITDWRDIYGQSNATTTGMTTDFANYSDRTIAKFKEVAGIMPSEVEKKRPDVRNSYYNSSRSAIDGWNSGVNSFSTKNTGLINMFRFKNGGLVEGYANGGYISGAGGPTSDSIPARLSNGEFVMRAAAVKQYGVGFFNQLNQMRTPAYYSGGQVGASTGGSMVSLSPEDRALLRNVGGSGNIVLYADSKELARSVNDGNRQIVASGGRP